MRTYDVVRSGMKGMAEAGGRAAAETAARHHMSDAGTRRTAMRNVSAFLAVAVMLTVLTGTVEAQTTTNCTRIGNTLNCTSVPLGPSGGVGGSGAFLQGFADAYLRMQQSQPPIIVQPPTPAPAQSADIHFVAAPVFFLGERTADGLRPLQMRSTNPPIETHDMTMAEVRTCLADEVCGPNFRAFIPWTGVPIQQIGVRP